MGKTGSRMTKPTKGYLTGMASEYLVLSMLSRLGVEAYLSLGNQKSVDIHVINRTGRTLSVDVKSVQGYSSLVVNNVRPSQEHFIVFVVYNNRFQDLKAIPDVYVVPSEDVSKLQSTFASQKRMMKGKLTPYKDKWQLLS
jgi:hypothetical protein